MWACQACTKRRLQALVGDATVSSPSPRLRQPSATNPTRRTFQQLAPLYGNLETPKSSNAPRSKWAETRQQWFDSRGVRPANKPAKVDEYQDYVVRKHLKYLKDPLKLAEHVRKCLREGDIETTLATVRAASKSMRCTVSWNHLIDWYLAHGRMKAAIRTYNEMKKRAQAPDARTYTIIFNGAANHPEAGDALGKVIAIYQSMLTDRSPIKPNTIHVNAILKTCARAQNIDAMFAIADKLPPKGIRAPNNLTYTTIINALRINALIDLRSTLTPIQKRANKRQAMLDARRVWQEVTKRWQQGDIWIDEELVCAMGRILLLGEERDHDDILSLVEQAMNVPRQAPRLPIPAQDKMIKPGSHGYLGKGEEEADVSEIGHGEEAVAKIERDDPQHEVQNQATSLTESELGATESDLEATFLDQFRAAIEVPSSSKMPGGTYAKPKSNTLSLLMQALLYLRLREPATKYWELFTKKYGVRPDADNYHAYLRVLRVARASSDAAKLLAEMPQSYLQAKTFRIAIATCQRDKNNHNAFANASKILDIMQGTQRVPDIVTLHAYLELAGYAPSLARAALNDKSNLQEAQGKQLRGALDRLHGTLGTTTALLESGGTSHRGNESRQEFADNFMKLVQQMISSYDTLIQRDLVPAVMHKDLIKERSKLSAFITKTKKDAWKARRATKLTNKGVREAVEDEA